MIFNDFILTFFYQIIYMSIIATVIGSIILLLKKVIKKRLSPNANYLIWFVFLIALIFPIAIPSRISIYNYIDISDMKEVKNSEAEQMLSLWKSKNSEDIISKDIMKSYITNNNKILNKYFEKLVAITWFVISMVLLGRKMFSYFAMNQLIGHEEVEDERIIALFENCKKKLKIRRNIKLIRQDFTGMPSTIGIFNVRILVSDFFLSLDDVSITNVLMHELSHYKRKDNVVNFMILILKSLHWFNPAMMKMFKTIRDEMELATDEIAIDKMDVIERMLYCKTMVAISDMSNLNLKQEQVLGLSSTAKTLEKRIKMISAKEEFDKNSKKIAIITFVIIVLMSLILYPTSYGMFNIPQLYLKLENGEEIQATKLEENATINEITLNENDKINLIVKDGRLNDYIFHTKTKPNTEEFSEEIVSIANRKILYFERGEAIYKFTLMYGKNKSIDYVIKIIVE